MASESDGLGGVHVCRHHITFLVCRFVFSGGACTSTVAVIGTPGSVKCVDLQEQVSYHLKPCHVERGVPGGPVNMCVLRLSTQAISALKCSV